MLKEGFASNVIEGQTGITFAMPTRQENIKLFLINPFSWTRDGRPAYLPYGIMYLAGYLKQRGISVKLFDCNARLDDPVDEVVRLRPEFVGLSVLSGPVIKEALDITQRIKQRAPDTKIIWGGLHPTLFPSYCLDNKDIYFVVQGEGEHQLFRIVKGYEKYMPETPDFVDLNSFWPDYEAVDIRRYIANRIWADRVLTHNTSRGCLFRCAFCFNQGLPSQRWRGMNARSIYEQVKYLKENYDINGVQFYEDCFDADKKRVYEFCNLIGRKGIAWSHFSAIPLVDEKLLREEYKAGCRYIEYGVESGSDKILKMLNKKQSVAQIKDAFNKCKRAGIKAAALFMIGLPTETKEDLKMTQDLIDSLPSHIPICTIYRPYPATPLYDWCVKHKGFKEPKTLAEQADFYAYGALADDVVNVSEVSTAYLVKLKNRFYRRLILKEIWICLREFNFKRLWYHARRWLK